MDTVTLYKDGKQLICTIDKKDKFISLGWVLKNEVLENKKPKEPDQEKTKRIIESPDIHKAIYDEMKDDELFAYAKKLGIFVKKTISREELIKRIEKRKGNKEK